MCQYCGSQSCSGQCRNGWPYVNRPLYNPPYTTPFNQQCKPAVPCPPSSSPCDPCSTCNQNGCLFSIITDCVLTTKAYSCFNTSSGTSLTSVLDSINNQLCTAGSCKLKVNADDICCDYLANKIISDTLTITTVRNEQTGCVVLQVEAPQTPPFCQVKTTEADECCDYLANKITGSNGAVVTTVTDSETGCQTVNIAAPNFPDLSCLGKVKTNSSGVCDYLISQFTDGVIFPGLDTSGGLQRIKFLNRQITFDQRPNASIPISLDGVTNVTCSTHTSGYPAPQGESGMGIPMVGLAGWTERTSATTWDTTPKVQAVDYVRSAGTIQGLINGTYTKGMFFVPSGTYNISFSCAVSNNNASIGGTGFMFFFLNLLTNATTGTFSSSYVLPVKDVVTCQYEERFSSTGYVTGVTFVSDTYLCLRASNTVAVITPGNFDSITISFEKVV